MAAPSKARPSVSQPCPNCQRLHDISVYVTGQKISCACGIRFEVARTDVSAAPKAASTLEGRGRDGEGAPDALLPTLAPGSRPTVASSPGALEAQGAAPGPLIPGFELLEVLGKGGMGEVWKARQSSLNRVVALKLLPPKLAADREFVARFEKEAAALAALRHPNIIQIIDRGVAGEHYYIVMEFVPGRSLREVMTGQRPTPQQALGLALQIARAVEHAHEQQIVHRDLKPENILVDDKGHVKVADFGLAGMRAPNSGGYQLTATSVAMGTVNYMAPEQRRDAKNVDHRADLYSFGVVLYELLTGDLPVGRFRLPSQRVPGLDPRLDGLIERLLAPEAEGRPERATEVVAALEPVVSSTPPGLAAAAGSTPRGALATQRPESVLERSWSGFKVALMVMGALALLVTVARSLPKGEEQVAPRAAPAWYGDTESEVFAVAKVDDGLALSFGPNGEEELNVHAGVWKVEDGALTAVQWGNQVGDSDHPKLVPRAYVAHRYFSSDRFKAEVELQVQQLPPDFPPLPPEAQRFGELSFRIKELQVSVFAIPDVGLRLGWRYFIGGKELSGNSAQDLENLVADEAPVPASGKFRLGLELSRLEGSAVDVVAKVNGQVIAHKVLPGLGGQVGKLALGCRNLACRFTAVSVKGKEVPRPASKEP